MDLYTQSDIGDILFELAQEAGSQAKLAEIIGISASQLSMAIKGNKPGKEILAYIGYECVVFYRPIRDKANRQ